MIKSIILIPTYNRPAYLHRILDYYGGYGEDLSVIVADSSSDENKMLNREIISSVSNLNVKYLDSYATEIHPYHKFAHVVSLVNTEYCVFCADDDFIAPNGIEQSVDFLEKNQDFTVAHGRYFAFHLEDDDKGKRFCWTPAHSHQSILSPEAEDRLEYHLSKYSQPTIYGVHRTELLKMVYEEVLKSEVNLLPFGELLFSMLTIVYGKMKALDVFYAARNADSIIAGGSWPTLRDAIKAGIYDEEYAKFKDCLATHLNKQSQLGIEESMKLVDKAMSAYLKKYIFSKSKMAPLTTKAGLFLDRLNLPGWLDGGIRKSYARLTGSSDPRWFSLDDLTSSPDYEELSSINHHVLASLEMNVE